MTAYEVIPIAIGARRADSSQLLYLTDAGQPVDIVYRLWVLRSRRSTVLVDTGLPVEEAEQRGIKDPRDVEEALRSAGVEARDIESIVLTHLHWDHASNAARFPRASFFAQRTELEALDDPLLAHPSIGRFYSADISLFHDMCARGRFVLLDGDERVAGGIDVLHLGGHTRGSQAVAVTTPSGTAVLTGDVIPLNRNYVDAIPSGIHVDLADSIRALERIAQLHPEMIYTGHDSAARLVIRNAHADTR